MDHDEQPLVDRSRLRYLLTLAIHGRRGPTTIAELHAAVDSAGYRLRGRPSKAISDVLRTEVRRGRVVRVRRGVYAPGRLARSTAWWFRQQLTENSSGPAPHEPDRSETPRGMAEDAFDPIAWINARTDDLAGRVRPR